MNCLLRERISCRKELDLLEPQMVEISPASSYSFKVLQHCHCDVTYIAIVWTLIMLLFREHQKVKGNVGEKMTEIHKSSCE